jgi:hypothetical protein
MQIPQLILTSVLYFNAFLLADTLVVLCRQKLHVVLGVPVKLEKTVCLLTKSENCHQKMIFADLLSESFGQFQKNSFRKK